MGQRYPLPITAAMLTPANANYNKPRYYTAGDWAGGATGDDVATSTALVALANSSGGSAESDYTPRTQSAKATALGTTIVDDVGRPRGWIGPLDPYSAPPGAGANPTISSLAPTTAAATTLPITVTITGTNFTPFSEVLTGGSTVADASAKYVSATTMRVAIFRASAGTVGVQVRDHGVTTAATNFTVT